MTDIRIENERGEVYPFQEDVDVRNFYAGGQRGEILEEIVAAVRRDTSVLILSGEAGSGKTMICRVLEQQLFEDVEVIVFPRTVESFDDVVRKIALRFGIEVERQTDRKHTENYLGQILEYLHRTVRPVLVVFDEAENLYLATLERIRKMQDRFTENGGRLQLMFSGRRTFLENNEQLSICDFINNNEVLFLLPQLEDDEAYDYIHSGLGQLEQGGFAIAGAAEMLPSIIENGRGNFGNLNHMVRQALQHGGEESSFSAQLDDLDEEQAEKVSRLPRFQMPELALPSNWSKYLAYAVGGLFILLLALWFWPSGDESEQRIVETQDTQFQSLPPENIDNSPPGTEGQDEQVIATTADEQSAEDIVPPMEEPLAPSQDEQVSGEAVATSESPGLAPAGAEGEKVDSDAVTMKYSEDANKASVASSEEVGNTVEPAAEEAKTENITPEPVPTKVVVLTAGNSVKRKPAKVEKEEAASREKGSSKAKSSQTSAVQEVIASNAHFTAEQLYQKRVQAGVDWKVGERNDMYTVQLMVLTSKSSEQNLKQMLSTEEYRREAGNFFVFRKRSVPDVIFVFYGEYPTMSFARLAKDSLPQFLLKHQPYAISVKGAMAKVNR